MSDLLNSASLVMIPSGYAEDKVYSAVPTDGSGDLSFTRASNGTRINSSGLVEVCPWNLLTDSENFSSWNLEGGTLTSGQTDPNGGTTAYKYVQIPGGGLYSGGVATADVKFAQVWIKSVSGGAITCNISDGAAFFGTFNVTGTWQLFTAPYTANSRNGIYLYAISNASGIYVWHPQLNIGSTAKPYFPTTDRLNVPRLTYQNGGGGCPSLLLEKQSTNLFAQSNTFTSVGDWYIYKDSGSTFTQTSNYGISPDGTQNATRLQASITAGVYANYARYFTVTIGTTYTYSIYIKSLSGTPTIRFVTPNGSAQSITLTTNWERYTYTFTASSADFYGNFYIESPTSSSYDLLTYGAQLEASSYPTSYIPTTSASATRVADVCSKTGISSLIGQTEGVVFLDAKNFYPSGARTIGLLFTSGSAFYQMYINSSNQVRVDVNGSFLFLGGTIAENTQYKIAFAYKSGSNALYINGTQIATSASTTIPSSLTDFYVGNSLSTEQSGSINQAILFPTRLTNSELASLTTI